MAPAAGRPTRIADERGTAVDGRPDLRARVAWLARTNRVASPDDSHQRQTDFAHRLTEVGVNASSTRISMWENAHQAMSLDVLAGYEHVLGLAPGQLQATAASLSRGLSRRGRMAIAGPRAELPPQEAQERLDAVYDTAVRGVSTGNDWFALASYWHRTPSAMTPVAIVRQLTGILVDEVARSVGTAFCTRYQALSRLADHPVYSHTVVQAIQDFTAEPGVDSVVDVISVLGESDSPEMVHELVQLARTGTGRVRVGAVCGLETQLLLGSVSKEHLALISSLTQMLQAGNSTDSRLADMLTRQLGPSTAPTTRPAPGLPRGRSAPRRSQTVSSTTLHDYATAARDSTGLPHDPVLLRLLEEIHGTEPMQVRHHVALLLLASPYRSALADHALAVVQSRAPQHETWIAGWLLTYLALPQHTPALLTALPHVPGFVGHQLMVALTHAGGVTPDLDLRALLPDTSVDGAAVYAAGMSQHPALDAWAQQTADPSLSARAAWWRRHGGAVRT